VDHKRLFRVFQRKVKGKPKVESRKVPPFMLQKMLSHKYERTVSTTNMDGKDIKKLKVIKLFKNEGVRLDGDTFYCDSCHHKISYNNVRARIFTTKHEEAKKG
jgi:hypothetical protein